MALMTNKQFYIVLGVGAVGVYLAKQAAAGAVDAINPLNNDNVIYGFASGVTRALTGRETDKYGRPLTLGAWLAGA